MGLKDAFFKVLVGNNTTDNDIKKSAEAAEKAVVNAEQPEIEKVEEIVKQVDETTETSFITGEPEKELDEEPALKEDEAEDNSVTTEIHTEEPIEISTEETTETGENVKEVENTVETLDTAEKVNEPVEDIIKPVIDPTTDDYENCVYEEAEKEYDAAIVIANEKLTKFENVLVSGIHSIVFEVRKLLNERDE